MSASRHLERALRAVARAAGELLTFFKLRGRHHSRFGIPCNQVRAIAHVLSREHPTLFR